MAKWQRTLRLSPEWQQVEDNEIPVQQLAKVAATRLASLRPFGDDRLDSERQEIVEEFEWIAESETADEDDFDNVMHSLYEWADTPLDGEWNGKKACWIDRFGSAK